MKEISLYCCGCGTHVFPRLIDGAEAYPHREDLADLPFWKCDECGNFVGCHHKTSERTKPLGVIPTQEIKKARQHIHCILDPLWKQGKMRRSQVYAELSKRLGWRYHTAEIRTVDEARKIYRMVREMVGESL